MVILAVAVLIALFLAPSSAGLCPDGLNGGSGVYVTLNCSRSDPTVAYGTTDEFRSSYQFFGVEAVDLEYTCNTSTNASTYEVMDGVVANNAILPSTTTEVTHTATGIFTVGDRCTFSGCYVLFNTSIFDFVTIAIRPTPCIIDDTDECVAGTHNCDKNYAVCINTIGSFTCQCRAGYEGNGTFCDNINECASEGTHNCSANAHCIDTEGSYNCTCLSGYEGNGFNCTDIDECTQDLHNCSGNTVCTNTNGGYNCTCRQGYSGDGLTCVDVDECSTGTHTCDSNMACVNGLGSYACFCVAGYSDVARSGNDIGPTSGRGSGSGSGGLECTNINECLVNPGVCDVNANCTDTIGSFLCVCKSGFVGDGSTCVPVTDPPTEITPTHPSNCSENTCCNITDGHYCNCLQGFREAGMICLNINECAEGHECDSNARCTDTDGSYDCQCKDGYNGNGFECKLEPVVWVFLISAPIAVIAAISLTVLVICCFVHRRRSYPRDHRFFYKHWGNELDPDFCPVDVRATPKHPSPSYSRFNTLERRTRMFRNTSDSVEDMHSISSDDSLTVFPNIMAGFSDEDIDTYHGNKERGSVSSAPCGEDSTPEETQGEPSVALRLQSSHDSGSSIGSYAVFTETIQLTHLPPVSESQADKAVEDDDDQSGTDYVVSNLHTEEEYAETNVDLHSIEAVSAASSPTHSGHNSSSDTPEPETSAPDPLPPIAEINSKSKDGCIQEGMPTAAGNGTTSVVVVHHPGCVHMRDDSGFTETSSNWRPLTSEWLDGEESKEYVRNNMFLEEDEGTYDIDGDPKCNIPFPTHSSIALGGILEEDNSGGYVGDRETYSGEPGHKTIPFPTRDIAPGYNILEDEARYIFDSAVY